MKLQIKYFFGLETEAIDELRNYLSSLPSSDLSHISLSQSMLLIGKEIFIAYTLIHDEK